MSSRAFVRMCDVAESGALACRALFDRVPAILRSRKTESSASAVAGFPTVGFTSLPG
jgi:hypothetical protein